MADNAARIDEMIDQLCVAAQRLIAAVTDPAMLGHATLEERANALNVVSQCIEQLAAAGRGPAEEMVEVVFDLDASDALDAFFDDDERGPDGDMLPFTVLKRSDAAGQAAARPFKYSSGNIRMIGEAGPL